MTQFREQALLEKFHPLKSVAEKYHPKYTYFIPARDFKAPEEPISAAKGRG